MRFYKLQAVVLKAVNMREASQLLTLFSLEKGKVRAVAYGAAKPASRKRGAVQPFTCSLFLLRRGSDLDSVAQCEVLEAFPEVRESLERLACAFYLAELLESATAEGEPAAPLYWLFLETLRALREVDAQVLCRAFEAKMLALLGWQPCLEKCASCGGSVDGRRVSFHVPSGGILCPSCAGRLEGALTCHRGTVEWLKTLLRWETARLGQLKVGRPAREELKELLQKFMAHHLERSARSLAFLEAAEHV
ncbi:DNA repair protein RecO [Desulfovirgula thermocuniculi]|uniref:DNA repair protein RecO n=1 Tax=Desulfovirgula thermocuniculi TaxID=348842 RepID=UPI0004222F55|nr:DNA repair protein RecO [Desulfovirgula thermocuniculi]